VDLLGLVLRVLVTSASVPERTGAKKVLKRVHSMGVSEAPPKEARVNRLHTIWMDGGYRGKVC
jgi:putative transposase